MSSLRIVCAAHCLDDRIVLCVRHCDPFARASGINLLEAEQGFVDNCGAFHDRFSALKVAQEARQIIKKTRPKDRLFSEDLW